MNRHATNMVEDDTFIFADNENEPDFADEAKVTGSWKILIVDDEPEIHKITELALANTLVGNCRLEFLHAYSGNEALDILTTVKDIAVILLDVVMESDDAGLMAVRKIRENLKLTDVRIILRTGQPGYAPEESVIMEYDINDYKTKTELTRNKLLTSVFSAIRSFQQLSVISQSRNFLEQINTLNQELISTEQFQEFTDLLVGNSNKLFAGGTDAALLLNYSKDKKFVPEDGFWVNRGIGAYQQYTDMRFECVMSENVVHLISKAIKTSGHVFEDDIEIIYIEAKSCTAILVLNNSIVETISAALLQTYCANVGSSLDNSILIKQVSQVAYQDRLTGLANRSRFIQLLDLYTKNRLSGDRVMLLDIDHFSDINDGLGQEAGNALLLCVTERLKNSLDPSVTIARIGADIFGFIGTTKTLDTNVVLPLFNQSFQAEEHLIPINATLGICDKLNGGKNGLSVLKHTNIALNKAKKDTQSRYRFYETEMEDETSWRLGMIRSLVNDFNHGKLQVWYQPQLNVKTGRFDGMEALLRWPNSDGGFISPLIFIPLAEYSGLIVELGMWVLEQSCEQVKKLEQLGLTGLRVAVNISMPQFRNSNFVQNVIETAKKYDVDPEQIELEITESVVMDDPKLVIIALEELKKNKFAIAIDDFGTGFSSLSYLQQLPLDRIKVDREFIKDIGEGGDGIIAETVITLSQKLGKETVAEGIETQFQLDFIRNLNCDVSQGYFHAKPMPAEQLETFLLGQQPDVEP